MDRPTSQGVTRKLNPADFHTLALDYEAKRDDLAGHYCMAVLELSGTLQTSVLQQRFQQLLDAIPWLQARLVARTFGYQWQLRDDSVPAFFEQPLDTESSQTEGVHESLANLLVSRDLVAPVSLHVLRGTDNSLLALRWHHPLLDALGAELLLKALVSSRPVAESAEQEERCVAPVDNLLARSSWWSALRAVWGAQRSFVRLDRQVSSQLMTGTLDSHTPGCSRLQLDLEESTNALQEARRTIGMTGTALYFMGCLLRALEQTGLASPGEAFFVPYAVNLRRRGAPGPMLGNQVSFLFATAPLEVVRDRARLFSWLREQNHGSLRERLPFNFVPFMKVTSLLPLGVYSRLVRYRFPGHERASFWFSYTGEFQIPSDDVFGCSVTGYSQLSAVTAPPGFAVLVNQFQGRLSFVINYAREAFDSEWIETLRARLRSEVLNEL